MQEIFRSQFRLPQDLADKLKEAADERGRSMNAEIVERLEGSFKRHPDEGALQQLASRLHQQEFTIATLTTLAHSLAALYRDNPAGIEIAEFVLEQLAKQPNTTGERALLMDALSNRSARKPEKRSARHARITRKKAAEE